jgi:hypothetical protein
MDPNYRDVKTNPKCDSDDIFNFNYVDVVIPCDQMGLTNVTNCDLKYTVLPCNMDLYECHLNYQDMNWTWHYDNCTKNLSDYYEWNYGLSQLPVWGNTTISPQMPYIYSFWVDWHNDHGYGHVSNVTTMDIDHSHNTTVYTNGTHAFNQSHWAQNTTLYRDLDNNPLCNSWDPENITTNFWDCDDMGFHDYQWWCSITYSNKPCDMSNNTCNMWYYDMYGDYQQQDCVMYLADPDSWFYTLSNLTIWHNTSISEEMPWIWSYWENYYQSNIDWEQYEDLDWENPNCNTTDLRAWTSY